MLGLIVLVCLILNRLHYPDTSAHKPTSNPGQFRQEKRLLKSLDCLAYQQPRVTQQFLSNLHRSATLEDEHGIAPTIWRSLLGAWNEQS